MRLMLVVGMQKKRPSGRFNKEYATSDSEALRYDHLMVGERP